MPVFRFALAAATHLVLLSACNDAPTNDPTNDAEATVAAAPDSVQASATATEATAPDPAESATPQPSPTETTPPVATASEDAKPSPTTAAAASPLPTSAPTPASLAKPPVAFAQCRLCHAVEPGKNGVGPTLAGLMGSKAGAVPRFNFSAPLKASGIVWSRATLDQWLQGPMKMVPGTRMVTTVPNPEARKAIIDYLETVK